MQSYSLDILPITDDIKELEKLYDLSKADMLLLADALNEINILNASNFSHITDKTDFDKAVKTWKRNFERDYKPHLHGDYQLVIPKSRTQIERTLRHRMENQLALRDAIENLLHYKKSDDMPLKKRPAFDEKEMERIKREDDFFTPYEDSDE